MALDGLLCENKEEIKAYLSLGSVGWKDLLGADRVERLEFRWVTYEELFENLPSTAISEELKKFQKKHGAAT